MPVVSKVASMPPVSSPGNVHDTSWLKNRLNPLQPTQSLAQRPGRVRGPRHRPAQPVLPLGEERVVARGDEHVLGRGLDGRPVVAAELRQAGVEAAQDRRGRRLDREERLLDDLLAGDLLGLLEEDVRDAGRIGRGVEATAAPRRELLEERVRAAARADRREGDPVGLHLGQDRVVLAGGRPAVGQQDDVAPRRRRPLERGHRLVEPGEDVRLAVGADARRSGPGGRRCRRAAASGRPSARPR